MPDYEVYLSDARGVRIALLDTVQSISYIRTANRVSAWSISIPDIYPVSYIKPDHVIEIRRNGKAESVGLLRKMRYAGEDGSANIVLSGPSFLYLLDRAIIAYPAGSAQSAKSDYADDMIKAIIRENLYSSAIGARNLSSVGLIVQPDSSAGASIVRRFAWRNVLDTCQKFADESTQAGTRVYFDIVPYWSGESMFLEFRTYTGQRGQDRTYDSSTPVIFGADFGNLANPVLEYDYWDERNYVYAGGQGLGADRLVEEQSDTDRITISPWNRRELFVSVTNEQSASEVQSAAKAALDANKPTLKFTADLLSVPGSLYGVHWGWGDKVVATYRDKQFNGHIDTVRVQVDSNGHETIDAKIEVLE